MKGPSLALGRSAALVTAVVATVALLAGCSGGEPPDYDAEFRADFLERCEAGFERQGGPQICGCWYDTVSRTIPFEELADLDDLFGEDFAVAPSRVPGSELDAPLRTLAECVRTLGLEPTAGTAVPLPTMPRPPGPATTTTPTTVVG